MRASGRQDRPPVTLPPSLWDIPMATRQRLRPWVKSDNGVALALIHPLCAWHDRLVSDTQRRLEKGARVGPHRLKWTETILANRPAFAASLAWLLMRRFPRVGILFEPEMRLRDAVEMLPQEPGSREWLIVETDWERGIPVQARYSSEADELRIWRQGAEAMRSIGVEHLLIAGAYIHSDITRLGCAGQVYYRLQQTELIKVHFIPWCVLVAG